MTDRLAPRLLSKMPARVTGGEGSFDFRLRRGGDPAAVARGLLTAWRNRGAEDGAALPALLNSVALVCGRMSTMALGFLSWMLAARFYAPAEVGLASGAIAAMMLCVQLGLFGIGPAVIALFPQHQRQPTQLLNTAFSIVCGATLVAAVLFLALASAAFHELSVVGRIPLYALLFVAMTLFGTVGVLFDHISITLRRGDQVLTRNVLNGVVTLGLVALLPLVTGRASSFTIFASWVAGNLSCCVLGFVQLGRALPGYRYQPYLGRPLARQLLGVGLPNWALTLTERAPGPIMPIVVTELLSPVANARWYAVWMISWVVFIVPISVGQTLFAAAARQSGGLRAEVVRSIRSSLGLGCVLAVGVGVMAPLMLWFLGHGYAAAGVVPLRILVVGVLPLTVIQAYFAVCRARRNLLEAILTGTASGLCAIVGTAAAGVHYGLIGMAVAWLAVQVATAVWAMWRLHALTRRQASGVRRQALVTSPPSPPQAVSGRGSSPNATSAPGPDCRLSPVACRLLTVVGERLLVERLHRVLDEGGLAAHAAFCHQLLPFLQELVTLLPRLVHPAAGAIAQRSASLQDAQPMAIETIRTLSARWRLRGVTPRDMLTEGLGLHDRLRQEFAPHVKEADRWRDSANGPVEALTCPCGEREEFSLTSAYGPVEALTCACGAGHEDRALVAVLANLSRALLEVGRDALPLSETGAAAMPGPVERPDAETGLASREYFEERCGEESFARSR